MPEIREKGWVVCVRVGQQRRWHIVPWTAASLRNVAIGRYNWYGEGRYERSRRRGLALAVRCEIVVTDPRVTEGDGDRE